MFIISVCHRCIFLSYDGSFLFHSLVYTISVNFCRKNNFLKKNDTEKIKGLYWKLFFNQEEKTKVQNR